jgi:hypothetical protein
MKDLKGIETCENKFLSETCYFSLNNLIKLHDDLGDSIFLTEDTSVFHAAIIERMIAKSKKFATIEVEGKKFDFRVFSDLENKIKFISFVNELDKNTVMLSERYTK